MYFLAYNSTLEYLILHNNQAQLFLGFQGHELSDLTSDGGFPMNFVENNPRTPVKPLSLNVRVSTGAIIDAIVSICAIGE